MKAWLFTLVKFGASLAVSRPRVPLPLVEASLAETEPEPRLLRDLELESSKLRVDLTHLASSCNPVQLNPTSLSQWTHKSKCFWIVPVASCKSQF